jgi:hypothetical protein
MGASSLPYRNRRRWWPGGTNRLKKEGKGPQISQMTALRGGWLSD